MTTYERCPRIDWLRRQDFFRRYHPQTQTAILYWLMISGCIKDWIIFDTSTDECLQLGTKENIDRWWLDFINDQPLIKKTFESPPPPYPESSPESQK